MMQHQLMRQQMQMQGGGQMPTMPMHMASGMAGGGPGMGSAPSVGGGTKEGGAAFDFMNAKGDDAFNFVGDVMKGNKRSL
mmetsp:Transcript_53337/g.137957  ORF Transcript_53337/g.137957 Transcript_53337/m.137957 type:complete len:80 (-) Transcript_53337:430-669(-)